MAIYSWTRSIVVLAFVCAAIAFFGYRFVSTGDWADEFEVLSVTPVGPKYAVTYRYYHANSSARFTAVWLVLRDPPLIGSTEHAEGKPIAVWASLTKTPQISWHAKDKQPMVEIEAAEHITTSSDLSRCYFDYSQTFNLLCIDSDRVIVGIKATPPRPSVAL